MFVSSIPKPIKSLSVHTQDMVSAVAAKLTRLRSSQRCELQRRATVLVSTWGRQECEAGHLGANMDMGVEKLVTGSLNGAEITQVAAQLKKFFTSQ